MPKKYPDGWQIGTPDAVFEFAEPVAVKATGVMPYQTVFVETRLSEDRWVRAIEVQPGDRNVVHHALIHIAGTEEQADGPRDAAAEERGGFWGEYVPGQNTLVYPEGFAKKLPKGSRLKFQMHYTPNGTATADRTRVGVIYAKEPPRHEVRVAGIVNARTSIPPNAADHREKASLRLPFDAAVVSSQKQVGATPDWPCITGAPSTSRPWQFSPNTSNSMAGKCCGSWCREPLGGRSNDGS